MDVNSYTTLITAEQLLQIHPNPAGVMVFDCSFDLMDAASGETAFGQAHIPGAVYADLNRNLSDKTGQGINGGRHPLPSPEKFAQWLGASGFSNPMQAVVYDRQGANYCGRLWWMLKWLGHAQVAVLNGGWQAWLAAGGAAASGPAPGYPHAAFAPKPSHWVLENTESVASKLGRPGQTLIDARATPRYKGEVEPLDPVAGHIPGALNRPFSHNIGPDGKFKPAAQLKSEFEVLLAGRNPATVVHHCGSGVSAIPNLLAMEIAGLGPTALYAGSWSEWCSDASRPMAQG